MGMKIRRFKINKLVRDNIEQFFLRSGAVQVNKKTLSAAEFDAALRDKISEEALEVCEAKTGDELVSECADVMEVLDALLQLHDRSWDEVLAIGEQKATERGTYTKRLFIDSVDLPDGSEAARYYAANPQKYPELPVE